MQDDSSTWGNILSLTNKASITTLLYIFSKLAFHNAAINITRLIFFHFPKGNLIIFYYYFFKFRLVDWTAIRSKTPPARVTDFVVIEGIGTHRHSNCWAVIIFPAKVKGPNWKAIEDKLLMTRAHIRNHTFLIIYFISLRIITYQRIRRQSLCDRADALDLTTMQPL